MVPRKPDEEEEENPVCPYHLHLFRPGDGRAERDSQFRSRDGVSQEIENAVEQGTGQKEEPEGKRNLSGGQKGKADKSRIDIYFQFMKTGEKAGV